MDILNGRLRLWGYRGGVHASIADNYTYGEIFGNLSTSVPIFLRTLVKKLVPWIAQMFGYRLSGFNLKVFEPIICLFAVVVFLALFSNRGEQEIRIEKYQRIIFFTIHLLACLAIIINMFHASTLHGSEYIGGVQGRYFLPTFPLAMLACYIPKLSIKRNLTKELLFSAAFLNLAVVFNIFCVTV